MESTVTPADRKRQPAGSKMETGGKAMTSAELTTMALLAALLCVSSYISIRLPFSAVPITAQTVIINLAALLLKPRKALLTVVIWALLGIVGVPVFSGGTAGFGVLAGPTGGYIIGYIVSAFLVSLACGQKNKVWRNLVSAIGIGIPVIYLLGTPWMAHVAHLDAKAALAAGVLPFIPGDIIKCILAAYLARALFRVVNRNER